MRSTDIINGWCDNVFRERKKNKVFPNTFVDAFEADILEITKSGYAYEYEVKVSRSDFFIDAKKRILFRKGEYINKSKYAIIEAGQRVNYFYYIVPEGLIAPDEVPDFAGLVFARHITCRHYSDEKGFYGVERLRFDTIKTAKRLTKEKFSQEKFMKCLESTYYRFHNNRTKQWTRQNA